MKIRFGVETEVETTPDAYVAEEAKEENTGCKEDAQIVTFDENGNAVSQNNLTEAIVAAQKSVKAKKTNGKKLVVVLDPGHGGYDGGAQGNGLAEKNLNLSIATYCKKALEKYAGVKVYMTRSTDVFIPLEERTSIAQRKGCDIFVSIHINSALSAAAVGAEVYYPNGNYNATAGAVGKKVADNILAQLAKLGLANRGNKVRNATDGAAYPDGSLEDYYSVIRTSKYKGFAGIIVEHGFISSSDAVNFFNSEAKLKKLGEADAKGIARHTAWKQRLAKRQN